MLKFCLILGDNALAGTERSNMDRFRSLMKKVMN
jgi:hypothetical protein